LYGNVKLRYKTENAAVDAWELSDYNGVTIPPTLGKPILQQILHLQEENLKGIMTSDMYLHTAIRPSLQKDEFLIVPNDFAKSGAQLIPGIYYMRTAAKEAVMTWDQNGHAKTAKNDDVTYALVLKGRVEGTITVPRSGAFKIGVLDFDNAAEGFDGILGLATFATTRGENGKPLVPHITETNSGPAVLGLHDLFAKIAEDRGEKFSHPRPEIESGKAKGKWIYNVKNYLDIVGEEPEEGGSFFLEIE
jgi:hypothetical protein